MGRGADWEQKAKRDGDWWGVSSHVVALSWKDVAPSRPQFAG
jgi:hypothetical protein